MTEDLEKLAAAARATRARFAKPAMRLGHHDCVRMTAFHLRQLGYQVRLPPAGAYRTVPVAMRLLRQRGFDDLAAALDATLGERIAPAQARIGDIIMIPAEGPFGGTPQIYVGNGRTFGYHQEVKGAAVLQPLEYVAAWRA